MTSEAKIKLTTAQREFLSLLCRKGKRAVYAGYPPAKNLAQHGFAKMSTGTYGGTRIEATPAGRSYYTAHIKPQETPDADA